MALAKCLDMTQASVSPSEEILDLQNALAGPISSLRSLVSRSFPELLVDIKTNNAGGTSSAISDMTYSTLTYLEALPGYEKTVEGILSRSQSERSWLMGSIDTPSPARSANEEGGIVNLYVGESSSWAAVHQSGANAMIADVIGTLLIHLDGRSRSMRKPVGYAFLLNNCRFCPDTRAVMLIVTVSHVRNTTSSFSSDIIGPTAEDMLNRAFRTAKK